MLRFSRNRVDNIDHYLEYLGSGFYCLRVQHQASTQKGLVQIINGGQTIINQPYAGVVEMADLVEEIEDFLMARKIKWRGFK